MTDNCNVGIGGGDEQGMAEVVDAVAEADDGGRRHTRGGSGSQATDVEQRGVKGAEGASWRAV